MRVWLIKIGEALPLSNKTRRYRMAMLAETLAAAGHDVTWWASTFVHGEKQHIFDGPRSIPVSPGLTLELLHAPGYRSSVSLGRVLQHRITAETFWKRAHNSVIQPDIIFCALPTLELSQRAVMYGKKHDIPVLIDIRDLWPDHYLTLVPRQLRSLFRVALSSEYRRLHYVLTGATGIIGIADTYLNWALHHAKRLRQENDGVFPIGFSGYSSLSAEHIMALQKELRSKHGIQPNTLVITFVGSFHHSHNLVTVINAARVLHDRGCSDVQFVIVGDGDNGPMLREQARNLENVAFTGWLDQLHLAAILGISSIGLAPYSEDAMMSLPNKPFEYMAAGLPLLSSLHGELENLIHTEDIGIQYKADDVMSLVSAIDWLLNHRALVQEMGHRSYQLFVERYSTALIYPRLVKHLEQIVSKRSLVQGEKQSDSAPYENALLSS